MTDNNSQKGKQSKAQKKRGVTITPSQGMALIILAVVLAVLGLILFWLNSLDDTIDATIDEQERQEIQEELAPQEDSSEQEACYVAVLGIDYFDTTDVTMLARVDSETGKLHLISIPRDTLVNVEGHGVKEIGEVYSLKGTAGTISAVSTFAGVPISHHVNIHIDGLVRLVDQLGGITIDVPSCYAGTYDGVTFAEGEQTLDGKQAIALIRMSYASSESSYSSSTAQTLVFEGILEGVLSCNAAEMAEVVTNLAAHLSSDLNVSEMVDMALRIQKTDYAFETASCPSYPYELDGSVCSGTMFKDWQDLMRRVDAGLSLADTTADVPEPQASSTTLGAAENGASPRDYEAYL